MGDYFAHWLKMGETANRSKLPRIFLVNWFLKDGEGKFLWPGYGENTRVLKWIVGRLEGTAAAVDTPIGRVPTPDSLDLDGMAEVARHRDLLLDVNYEVWVEEAARIADAYAEFADRLPPGLWEEHGALVDRLTNRAAKPSPPLPLQAVSRP
jgi:phosphoenolpyruvate carboxykinase (GTP)